MGYTGKKPTNVVDVSETQSLTVDGDLTVDTNTLKVDSANNRVGVGTASPAHELVIQTASADPTFRIHADTDSSPVPALELMRGANDTFGADIYTDYRLSVNAGDLKIEKAASGTTTTPMTIDATGRLLVAKTAADSGVAGFEARNTGETFATASGTAPFYAHRLSDDGDIAIFQAAGTTVAKITVSSSDNIAFGATAASGSGLFYFSGSGGIPIILPAKANSAVDNEVDLGRSAQRFQDIFASNGTIQTSDQNEKQDIASLTSAEITAAKAISKLFKTFKWKDRVASKGDSARTHAGVIAQEVQSAMSDAGLDVTKYAFWCSDTFWEKDVEVPAVEADEENGTKARDAFTRTDVYETEEEAPEGATERTRLGIRYPELLAFIGAATEQRLTDIETRLTTLEG